MLSTYNAAQISSCEYNFSINSTKSFYEIAHTVLSANIGATIGIIQRLALTDPALTGIFSSILSVQARQDTFFRHRLHLQQIPSPLDTRSADLWAYNIALSYVVPGSCPFQLSLPSFPVLKMTDFTYVPYSYQFANSTNNSITVNESSIGFGSSSGSDGSDLQELSWDPNQTPFKIEEGKQLLVSWVNQFNSPVYTDLNIIAEGKGITRMPQNMNGIALAVITSQQYETINELVLATMAGPVVVLVS
jgi:hypothetical protein